MSESLSQLTPYAQAALYVSLGVLAGWIVEGRADYRLIDLRDETAFGEYHVPTAENVPLTTLGEHLVGLLAQERRAHGEDLGSGRPNAEAWQANYEFVAGRLAENRKALRELLVADGFGPAGEGQ